MHDDKWDEHMRRLLNEVEKEYDPASWDKLNDRLDGIADEEEDELFDNLIKEKLEPHTSPVPPPNWAAMEEALAISERRHRKIVASKSLEAIIVILAFFTFWNYRTHTTPQIVVNESYVNTIIAQNEVMDNVMADISHTISDEKIALFNNESRVAEVIIEKQYQFFSELMVAQHAINIGATSTPDLHKVSLAQVQSISTKHQRIADIASQEIVALHYDIDVNRIPTTSDTNISELYNDNAFDGWAAGIAQSYDAIFVNSDVSLNYLGDQIRSGLPGHTMSISLAYRKGPIEVSSGIGYSAKAFAPGQFTQYRKASANSSAFLQSKLDEIHFKQIQIPLAMKLFLAPKSRVSGYITAGIVANALLETDYTVRRSIQANARPATDPRVNVLDLSKPPLGLGNGGNFQDNFYATGMIGIGVQSYLKNGLSFYVQPQYQLTLSQGINEIANEINTFSFTAGLQFSL